MSGNPVKGADELLAFFQAFPQRVQNNAMRSAVRAAAKVVLEQARADVPVESGLTRKAIKISSTRVKPDGTVSAKIKLLGPHSYIGYFVEYGVKAHLIQAGDSDVSTRQLNKRAKKSGVLKDEGNGLIRVGGYGYMNGPRGRRTEDEAIKINDKFIRGAVLHPGVAAKPFMRPALDLRADDAVRAAGDQLRKYLKDKTGFTAPLADDGED